MFHVINTDMGSLDTIIASIKLSTCLWFIKGVKTSARPIRAALIIQTVTGGSWDWPVASEVLFQMTLWIVGILFKSGVVSHETFRSAASNIEAHNVKCKIHFLFQSTFSVLESNVLPD